MYKINRYRRWRIKRLRKWILCVAMLLLIAAAVFFMLHSLEADGKPAAIPDITPAGTPANDELPPSVSAMDTASLAPAANASPTPTMTPTSSPPDNADQPPLLTQMLQKYGHTFSDIDAGQLLMLAYEDGDATLYLYDKDSAGLWSLTHSFSAYAGRNGVSDDKQEGDKKTPAGYYAIGFAFGNENKPDTEWEYRDVTPDSYWVDDPDSAYYNTWVEGTESKDWDSATRLSGDASAYAYALVIAYNMDPVVPGRGSAIILHCGDGPSSGCVLVSRSDMLTILKWLNAGSNAHILIADIG